jgi:spore maturation protein CgeB
MKLFLLGRRASITHWLEEAAQAFRADGHEVRVGIVRDPRLHPGLQRALTQPIAVAIAARVARFEPDLVLAVGGLHVPAPILERIAALPARPPLVGWVGDAFNEDARAAAALYDLIAYTDTGLVERHRELAFAARAAFAAHGVDPHASVPAAERAHRMVFVALPTPARRAVVAAVTSPLALYGAGWTDVGGHEVHAGRLPARKLLEVYAGHLASLNIRNEVNVLTGLNQRNFQPYLAATPLVTDDQPDLPLCFEPGREALVWRDADELNDLYARLLRAPDEAAAIGEAGRRRVLAEHTYGQRLAAIAKLV